MNRGKCAGYRAQSRPFILAMRRNPRLVTVSGKTESDFAEAVMDVSVSEAAAILGRLGGRRGGQSRSLAKVSAARQNGKLGGRPKLSDAQIQKFADKVVGEWRELAK